LAYLRWTFLVIEQRWIQRGILEHPGEIFFLELEEIQEQIQAKSGSQASPELELTPSLREKIQLRHMQWQEDQQRQIPSVVYGSFLPSSSSSEIPNTNLTRLTGIPASRGISEGIVKIYHRLGEKISLDPDTIVILPYTDAGWAPLLVGAKAIISEVGGQLSHGAILAREYGIPAVMNVTHATQILKDGQRVRVDGYLGIVDIDCESPKLETDQG
jgi:pyruvate,water dikinase